MRDPDRRARGGRSQARRTWTLWVLVVIGVLCGSVLIRLLGHWVTARLGVLVEVTITVSAVALVTWGVLLYGRWAAWALSRWAARDGWTTVTGRQSWPWTTGRPEVAEPVVLRALAKTVDGFPVTMGEVTWAPGGMLDVAGAARGRGFFAVLRLPHRYPRLGVHRKLDVHRPRPGQDEFDRHYWTICADAGVALDHIGAEVKAAHLAGKVPDWMLVEDELYVVARGRGPLTPAAAAKVIRQVCRLADLLRLTRD